MDDVIAVFSKRISKEEVKKIADLISAKSVTRVQLEKAQISEFYEVVLGKQDCSPVVAFKLEQFSFLSPLVLSDLRPIMIFQGGDGVLDTIQKYGHLTMVAGCSLRMLDVVRSGTSIVYDEKTLLGLDVNLKKTEGAIDNIRPLFEAELDEIIVNARQYYSLVSEVEG